MNSKFIFSRLFIIFVSGLLLLNAAQGVFSQQTSLTLAEVLTGLQAESGNFTLGEKNDFIAKDIMRRGITFRLTPDIESELLRAGASNVLMTAIRTKAPKASTIRRNNYPNADVKFDKIWVDYNVTENGKRGMRVHNKFTVHNLKDVQLYMSIRLIRESGNAVSDRSGKTLAISKPLNPGYDSAVYSDYSVFVPYSDINLPAGQHNLKIDSDLFYNDQELLKHLTVHNFVFTQPGSTSNNTGGSPTAKFERMWIDYNVRENGLRGMRVHLKFTVSNWLNRDATLAFGVETKNGDIIYATSGSRYASKTRQLTFYVPITPKYPAATFSDVKVFIPYNEINLSRGQHDLRIHSDLLYGTDNKNVHITYYNFRFTK